jgi:DNA helicase-2/ATP-dependent DNA helicase PcrA
VSERYHITAALVRAASSLRENAGQWAVYTSEGNQIVMAGPGSGKTHVLSAKVARLLAEDVTPPQAVACVTYNNECVREFRTRLRRLGVTEAHNVVVTTVHGFCLRHVLIPFARLANSSFPSRPVVATEIQRADMRTAAAERVLGTNRQAWPVSPWDLFGRVDRHRVRAHDRAAEAWKTEGRAVRGVIVEYEKALAAAGLVDFDTMVLSATSMIREHDWVRETLRAKFPVLVVDEYQDLGVPLDAMVVALVRDAGVRLIAVGDPDQSIYGFTGTDPRLLQGLGERLGVKPLGLRLNYRSGRKIIQASTVALGEERDYESRYSQPGEVYFYYRRDGIRDQATFTCGELIPAALARNPGLALGDVAVIYPTKNEGTAMSIAAATARFPVQRIDTGAPYRKTPLARWLEDSAAWCAARLPSAHEPRAASHAAVPSFRALLAGWIGGLLYDRVLKLDEIERHRLALSDVLFASQPGEPLARWLTRLRTDFLEEYLPRDAGYAETREEVKALIGLATDGALANTTVDRFGRQLGDPTVLNLVTLHSAKGLEFDLVVLLGLDEGVLPRWNATAPGDIVEARRLFYVGLTRARREVHILYSGFSEAANSRRFMRGPSRFVKELQDRLTAEREEPAVRS